MAREFGLPVQIHTGHMAGIRNDVAKANARGLRSLVEIHRDVQFDLFHANWPYADDIVFLVKNYPNVAVDFCWTHIVDPLYSRRLLKQLVSSVPYTKIHGFGSDVGGAQPHIAWAHCAIAKENIASALADMVDDGYIQDQDALEIAEAWLFGNPNRFFDLKLSAEHT
jgi:predicted TIM-barrel fold metal-dependent hydrolase